MKTIIGTIFCLFFFSLGSWALWAQSPGQQQPPEFVKQVQQLVRPSRRALGNPEAICKQSSTRVLNPCHFREGHTGEWTIGYALWSAQASVSDSTRVDHLPSRERADDDEWLLAGSNRLGQQRVRRFVR